MKITLPERSEQMTERLGAITDVIRELVGDDLVMLILFGSYLGSATLLDARLCRKTGIFLF